MIISKIESSEAYNNIDEIVEYSDGIMVARGDLGVELLEENNFIRKFIDDDKYDDIIKIAIKNHNKYEIEPLDGEKLLQAKIIKDADKIDIFYQLAYQFAKDKNAIENSEISEDYMKQLKEG